MAALAIEAGGRDRRAAASAMRHGMKMSAMDTLTRVISRITPVWRLVWSFVIIILTNFSLVANGSIKRESSGAGCGDLATIKENQNPPIVHSSDL
ncbi:hypothetical protein [Burkholderia gladioli]|uniref:hypothetical protein n=1 Tax=Burkholderia gladioli TaxID=28095 RepID=UPI00164166A1|nr:hypothetical protein [Burkholderia gladioli]